ncbi:DASH complex subunit [Lachnellula occidentalis]|uniref:DASH complex subunit n=1 Tax=Lachnellula occidentalis TaxID=215460 RepID=A0A8H8S413_9HELO|nr:DASH complex subunit [Lachnellula occidentalis]
MGRTCCPPLPNDNPKPSRRQATRAPLVICFAVLVAEQSSSIPSSAPDSAAMDSNSPLETPAGQERDQGRRQAVSSSSDQGSSPIDPQNIRQSSSVSPQNNNQLNNNSSTSNSHDSKDKDKDNKDRVTVPSACVPCRSKHLKCDGLNPCTRCSSNGFECLYVRSRRGFKGPRKTGLQGKASSIPLPGAPSTCPLIDPAAASSRAPQNIPTGLATPPDHRQQTLPGNTDLQIFEVNPDLATYSPKPLSSGLDIRERCIEAFYYHFWPTHPFALPRASFMALRKERPLDQLEAAMRYVGSCYVSQAPTVALASEAEHSVYADCANDGFRVQAMLILAIGLDGNTHQEKALQILTDAEDIALDIGMNNRNFAFLNSAGSPVLEESWRRTYWELFLIDGMIAGVHQKSFFRMKDVVADVLLPCEECEYLSGVIPQARSLADFEDELFDGRDFSFSSFAYRVAAIRNLGRILTMRMSGAPLDSPAVQRLDAHLVNWRLHLPDSKRTCISKEGVLDEMLFQAHMITAATTVQLHRELSELDSSVAKNVTSCAPHKPVVPGESYNLHAAKTVQAAQDISKLITIPVPLLKHTHFFTCVVTLGSIVHLSCWSILMPITQDDDLRQQLRLNTGALKTLWQVWPSAGRAFGQVKGVAQDIFAAKKRTLENGYWPNLTEEDIMQNIIQDQSIMDELQIPETDTDASNFPTPSSFISGEVFAQPASIMESTESTSASASVPNEDLSPLEQDVLDEYERLAENMKKFASLLDTMAGKPTAEILDGLRQLERKTSLVFTLLKASVYSIVLQQEIYSGDQVGGG